MKIKKLKQIFCGVMATAMAVTLLPGMNYKVEAARLPETSLSEIEEGSYTVPVRLFELNAEGTDSKLSMGDSYVAHTADVEVTAGTNGTDGKIQVSLDVDLEAGMTYFSYFNTKDDYDAYIDALRRSNTGGEALTEEEQMLQKDHDTAPNDVSYETEEKTYTEESTGKQMTVQGIKKLTFTISECKPIYYAGFNAVGMNEGTITQYAKFGFDWDELQKKNSTDPDNPNPDNPDPDNPNPDNPSIKDNIIVKRYQELKEKFEALNPDDYVTYDDANLAGSGVGWVTLENLFKKYDAAVADGTVNLEELKPELQAAYEAYYDPTKMLKKSNALEPGYTYEVPVRWVSGVEKTISFDSGDENDLQSFTVLSPDEETEAPLVKTANEYIEPVALITVKNHDNTIQMTYSDELKNADLAFCVATINAASVSSKTAGAYTPKGTGKTKPVKTYTATKFPYLFEGYTPGKLRISRTTPLENHFVVFDYANAKVVDGSKQEVDKSELQSLYNLYYKGYAEYTRDSLRDYTLLSYEYAPSMMNPLFEEGGVFDQAGEVLNDESATQVQVDNAYNAIYDKLNNSSNVKLMRDEYYEKYDEAKALLKTKDSYTEESVKALQDAYNYCKALENFGFDYIEVDGKKVAGYLPGEGIEVTPEEVETGTEVNNAIANGEKTEEDFSTEEIECYKKLLLVSAICQNYTHGEELNRLNSLAKSAYQYKAICKIDAAIAGLEKYGDTTEISNTISELETIINNDGENYTIKSLRNLKDTVAEVKEKVEAGKLTDVQIAELMTTLQNAKAGLVDRSALKTAIDHAQEIAAQTDKYTEASLAMFNAELGNAKNLYASIKNVTAEEIGAQIASLQAAEQSLVEKSSEDLDKDKLADGKYMVDVNLWHATQDKESMGNQALYHHGIITVKDGKYSLMIVGHEVTVGNITGKLKGLQVKPGGTAGEEWVTPDSVDGAGDGNYAFQFELTSKGEKEYLPSRIMVEEGTPMGTDWVESRLRISWDTLKKTGSTAGPSEIISGEIVPDVSGPFYYKDGATGVIVQAKEGVLPNGATVVVKKGTLNSDGSVLNSSLANYVKQYEIYTVTAYDADGNEIQPDGILSISIPVPDGYDSSKLALYQLESTGTLKLLQGTNEDGLYTVNAASTGQFAIAEKIASTVKKPNNTLTTKTTTGTKTGTTLTTTPKTSTKTGTKTGTTTKTAAKSAAKTGDQANVALYLALAGLALAAGAVVIVRRRKEYGR